MMYPRPMPGPRPTLPDSVMDYVNALSEDLSEWDQADEAAELVAEMPPPQRGRMVCPKHPEKACPACGSSPGWAARGRRCRYRGNPCHGTRPNFIDRKPCWWCERECPECGATRGSIACVAAHGQS